jgi:hypothetical protein
MPSTSVAATAGSRLLSVAGSTAASVFSLARKLVAGPGVTRRQGREVAHVFFD